MAEISFAQPNLSRRCRNNCDCGGTCYFAAQVVVCSQFMNCEHQCDPKMQLKPQDILILLKLVDLKGDWSYRSLAHDLFMSTGEIHNALDRASRAQLYDPDTK